MTVQRASNRVRLVEHLVVNRDVHRVSPFVDFMHVTHFIRHACVPL